MLQHIAQWNPTTQLWETEQADLFSERQEPFSETWPTSGMTRSGRLLPLPMSGHRIGGNECSSLELLHTPDTMPDAPNKKSNTKSKPAGLGNQVIEIAAQLLPTPQTINRCSRRAMLGITDAKGNRNHWTSPGLEQALEIAQGILPREFNSWDEVPGSSRMMLPTPRAKDGMKGGPNQRGSSSGDLMLPSAVMNLDG